MFREGLGVRHGLIVCTLDQFWCFFCAFSFFPPSTTLDNEVGVDHVQLDLASGSSRTLVLPEVSCYFCLHFVFGIADHHSAKHVKSVLGGRPGLRILAA